VLGILTGQRGQLPAPREHFLASLPANAHAAIDDFLAAAVIGSPQTVQSGFQQLLDATQADEFVLVSDVFDPALRMRSLDIAAQAITKVVRTPQELVFA
jgi:alkanesulfonate monooxygenase SsuD/methylene tetrahydromethanopterin reductase-like flavin-dependent oxidoreductase (luciferase family)